MPFANQDIAVNLIVDSSNGEPISGAMQTGEGSDGVTMLDKKKDVDKGSNDDGTSFFDCNICLDLSKEPVVTSCGHLFCWPCLYRWLHIHSNAKECPVCKGEVTVMNVTPVYGRGNGTREMDPTVKIPDRPPARRVEGSRQAIQRTAFSISMEEMIRRLGSLRDFFNQQETGNVNGNRAHRPSTLERTSSLLNRISTIRGIRREHISVLTNPDTEPRPEFVEQRRFSQLYYRLAHTHRAPPPPPLPPHIAGTRSTDRFFEGFMRNEEPIPSSVEDRDSISSIMGVIHGESQTIDTAVEIESTLSLSTSSSRRRHDASRMSDSDSVDSRMPRRRRRLN